MSMKKIVTILLCIAMLSVGLTAAVSASAPYTDTSAWKITASSELPSSPITKAFDGDIATMWHTNYTSENGAITSREECPHEITITFPSKLDISAVRYIPRQKTATNGSTAGIWKKAEIYGSTDGKTFQKLADAVYDVSASRAAADTAIARDSYAAIRIVVTSSDGNYGTAAEIQMINPSGTETTAVETTKTASATETTEKTSTSSEEVKSPGAFSVKGQTPKADTAADAYACDSSWTIDVSSALGEDYPIRMFDGNPMNYWHSWYHAEDGKITKKDIAPFTITVTFGEEKKISGIRYTPRQIKGNDASTSGIFQAVDVYASSDGTNFSKIATGAFTYAANFSERERQTVNFDTVSAKAIRVVATATVSDYGTCAELEFLKGEGATKDISELKVDAKNRKVITMQIDSVNAKVQGKDVTLVKAPAIVDGRTLVPIRFVSENLGADVSWDEETRTVTMMDGTNVIRLTIDSDEAVVNGRTVKLDVPAMIMDASTMVPIRFVSENLGADVSWDGDTRTVTIESVVTVACWGDSLTAGDGATNSPYPTVIGQLSGAKVYNLGIGGETALTIAARQGAYDIVFTEDFTIPAAGTVTIPLATIDGHTYLSTPAGGQVFPRQITAKWNPAYINGVEGVLSFDVDTASSPRILRSVKFMRSVKGDPVPVKKGDKLITSASKVRADINVIYIGCNGIWDEDNSGSANTKEQADKLIAMIRKMIANTKDPETYLVVGFTFSERDAWSVVEEEMKKAFGEHYLVTKPYLSSEQALIDAGVTATEKDKADMAKGMVPVSLRKSGSDMVHLNDKGYTLLGTMIYEKLVELGYLE